MQVVPLLALVPSLQPVTDAPGKDGTLQCTAHVPEDQTHRCVGQAPEAPKLAQAADAVPKAALSAVWKEVVGAYEATIATLKA